MTTLLNLILPALVTGSVNVAIWIVIHRSIVRRDKIIDDLHDKVEMLAEKEVTGIKDSVTRLANETDEKFKRVQSDLGARIVGEVEQRRLLAGDSVRRFEFNQVKEELRALHETTSDIKKDAAINQELLNKIWKNITMRFGDTGGGQ